jgi:hypothetical protein
MPTGADGGTAAENIAAVPFDANIMLDPERPPDDTTMRDHVVNYLRVASSVEHALMVQYLFAAYSLDPQTGKDKRQQEQIADWQNLMLSVAKEEMGHLLTVQNVLCLLGAPVELSRNYRYRGCDSFPFAFSLEPLTMTSIARYVAAEMSDNMPDPRGPFQEIYKRLLGFTKNIPRVPGTRHVGEIYQFILKALDRIPDREFHQETYRFQASWDDWGRGYNTEASMGIPKILLKIASEILDRRDPMDDPRRANVIIERVATRTQAKAALRRISEQGEAPAETSMGSHFERFLFIMGKFEKIREKNGEHWRPTHSVVENPHTKRSDRGSESEITCPRSAQWADLFDLRYHMLLGYLSHTFKLASDGSDGRLRGAVMHRVFAEMYNLKAIAGILVQLPLKDPDDGCRAGPPFSLPKSLAFPTEAIKCWRRHGARVRQALCLNKRLAPSQATGIPDHELAYLQALRRLDQDAACWIKQVIVGLRPGKGSAR